MQTEQELISTFIDNADQISQDFISSYELKHTGEIGNLSDPLLRWLDFVHRYIPPTPRQVFFSNKFPKDGNATYSVALQQLVCKMAAGGNINPYQSKGLILHNDVSGTKRQLRTDLLWADWDIHHLHLTENPISPNSYFSERSQWLLFCIVGNDSIGLIDVRDHDDQELFSDPDLIKTVESSWPEFLKKFRINGIVAPEKYLKPDEISSLRKGGVSSLLTIDNQVYMAPGMGVTSASTPLRVTLAMDRLRSHLSELARIVFGENNQFKSESRSSGIHDPRYSLAMTAQGLVVHEINENKVFVLPRGTGTFLAELHDTLAPMWATKFISENHSA